MTQLNADGCVLLDTRRGSFWSLDGLAAEIVALLRDRRSVDEVVEALATEYDAPRVKISEDVSTFLGTLLDRDFVRQTTDETPLDALASAISTDKASSTKATAYDPVALAACQIRRRDVARAWLTLVFVDAAILLLGFPRFRQVIQRQRTAVPPAPGADVQAVCASVSRAAVFHSRRTACLQRSATAAILLRRQGVPAALVIGCRKIPFYAHAWVEVDGQVVNDHQTVQTAYPEIDRL